MNIPRRWVLVLSLYVSFFRLACAQGVPNNPVLTASAFETPSAAELFPDKAPPISNGPTNGSSTNITSPTLQLSFADGKGQVSAALGNKLATVQRSANPMVLLWSLTITAPTSSSSNDAASSTPTGSSLDSFASSDQIPNGFKVSPKLSFFYAGYPNLADLDNEILQRQSGTKACLQDNAAKLSAYAKKVDPTSPAQLTSSACATAATYDLLQAYGYPIPPFQGYFFAGGIQPALQYSTSSYYAKTNLSKKSTAHLLPSITTYFSGGYNLNNVPEQGWQWVIGTAGFDYAGTLKNQNSEVECLNKTGATILSCVSGSIGSPKSHVSEVASIDAKISYGMNVNAFGTTIENIVADPKFSHDAATGGTSVDFPIYFVPKLAGGIIPGIDMGWTNTKHVFIVGAFLTTSFQSVPTP